MGENQLKEFGEIHVSEIMVTDPLYITPEEKISATELLMLRKKINGLPVVNNHDQKKVIGIITQRDIRLARFAMSLESPNTIVEDLMTPEPFIIRKDALIKEALKIMFNNDIERLPVVNDNNQLMGLLLMKGVLKKLLEYL